MPTGTESSVDAVTGGHRRRKLLALGLGLVLVAVAIAALARSNAPSSSRPGDTAPPRHRPTTSVANDPVVAPPGSDVVTQFAGTGNSETPEFQVAEGWEIRWETQGKSLDIAVAAEQGSGPVLRFKDGPGGGTTSPTTAGKVRLQVKSDGKWNLIIVNHKRES